MKKRKDNLNSESKKKLKKQAKPGNKKLLDRKLVSEKDVAMDFAVKVHQKFDRLIKASVLFGSQAKNNAGPNSDIDIILITDDASISWDMELIAWYREELAKIVQSQERADELHINTMRLTTFWQDILYGDPVVINILRYGEVLIDSGGFFIPLKSLLLQGKIKSTPEAVHAALNRVPSHILRSKASEMGAIEGVYWAMVDSAQAALMTAGKNPPSPEQIPSMLTQTFVNSGVLKPKYVRAMEQIYDLHKSISHGKLSDIKGQDVDNWQNIAEEFLSEITKIITNLLDLKK